MKVGVVIPQINLFEKYTRPALDSVVEASKFAKENYIEVEVIVIDNNSTDGSTAKVAGYAFHTNFPTIKVRCNDEMWGFQKSVNFGIKHFFRKEYGYDYVLVLNNDIVLHNNAIEQLIKRFEHGGVGMATCLDVSGEMNEKHEHPTNVSLLSVKEKEACSESPHPNFSAFMISRECWDKVGEFDEVFAPAYYEDNEWHHRMNKVGVKAVCYPPAMFYHYGSRTQNEALGRPMTDSSNQYARYIKKWGGGPGQETFEHPYNDSKLSVRSTKQSPNA